jgi:glycerol kinase
MLGRPVVRPRIAETTALGAAYAAGLASGFYENLADLRSHWAVSQVWQPEMTAERRDELCRNWRKAVTCSFDWIA